MIKTHIKTLTSHERSNFADVELGLILAFIAGAINAGGFLAVGYYTSHMTGIVSSVADFIVLNKYSMALMCLVFLFCFIAGAATSAFMINWARIRKLNSIYALPLMFEALLLMIFGLFMSDMFNTINGTIAVLCFIMGLQNAIITKISNSVIRTTHVTGMSTDIGIEIGRFLFRKLGRNDEVNVNFKRLKLHTSLLLSFLLGGLIGAYLYKEINYIAVLPFSAILLLIAIIPIIDDFKVKFHG
jgi:uncharacterized membrane protein YoaK (UPF0700 family)